MGAGGISYFEPQTNQPQPQRHLRHKPPLTNNHRHQLQPRTNHAQTLPIKTTTIFATTPADERRPPRSTLRWFPRGKTVENTRRSSEVRCGFSRLILPPKSPACFSEECDRSGVGRLAPDWWMCGVTRSGVRNATFWEASRRAVEPETGRSEGRSPALQKADSTRVLVGWSWVGKVIVKKFGSS